MECKDVQQRLAAYMEAVVAPEEKVEMDAHLELCQKCSEYLSDLSKTFEHVRKLEEIESPSWLTNEVMRRVRAEARPKRSILKSLFLPLHVKLPIHAAVLILVAIIGVYLFKNIQPEVKIAKAPPKEDKRPVNVEEKASEIAKSRSVPSKSAGELLHAREQETSVSRTGQGQRATEAITEPDGLEAKNLVETKGQSMSLTVYVKHIENEDEGVKRTINKLGGEVVKTVYLRKKRIIVARVHSEKMKELFEKLKQMGEIKQVPTTPQGWEGDAEITIELVESSINS